MNNPKVGHFPPAKRTGVTAHAIVIVALAAASAWGFWNLPSAQVGPSYVTYLLVALLAFVPIPILGYRAYALLRADYYIDRDSLAAIWGLRVEDIPLTDIEWVRPASDLTRKLTFPFFRMPGAVLGTRRHPDLGLVEFIASDTKNLILVATSKRVFGDLTRKPPHLEVAPYFYALSENYGSPEVDYLILYEQGLLTQEAKAIYEALLFKGPLDTVALRRATHMTSKESDTRFDRALTELQADFKILPVGVTESGAWRYAFAYDLVTRHFPGLPEQARPITERQARQELARLYFSSLGAARIEDLIKLFRWKPAQAEGAVAALVAAKLLRRDLQVEDQAGEWVAIRELTIV